MKGLRRFVVMGAATCLLTACSEGGTDSESSPSPRPAPSTQASEAPTASVTSPPERNGPDREVRKRFPRDVVGEHLMLQVRSLGGTSECSEGQFRGPGERNDPTRVEHAYRTAYFFRCSNVVGKQFHAYFFYAELTNLTGHAVRFSLERIVLTTGTKDSKAPVKVRGTAPNPAAATAPDTVRTTEAFLPLRGLVPPERSIGGWIVFDGRIRFVPRGLAYIDGDQTLTIMFVGAHRTH